MKRIFTGAGGLNTVDDPALIPFDKDTGIADLQNAVSVVVEPSGRLSMRPGYTRLYTGNYHSLFCAGGDCFVGKDGLLYQVMEDLTLRGIRSGLSGGWISFADTGKRVNYTNNTQNGVIENSVSSAWSKKGYEHPDELEPYYAAPLGSITWFCGGRAFVAVGDTVYYSEVTEPSLFKLGTRQFRLDSEVIMGVPVRSKNRSGAFISTTRKTYFVDTSGERPQLGPVANYPAIAGSACHDQVEGLRLGLQSPGLCAFWLAKTGVCVGLPDGSMINMTESRVSLTGVDSSRGATLLRGPQLIWAYTDCTTLCTCIERGDLTKKATTQFLNFDFNSFCNFNGTYLAASSAGLYSIGATNDNGTVISAYATLVPSDFGQPKPKWVRYLYLGHETTGALSVSTAVSEGSLLSNSLAFTAATQQHKRVSIGRGRKGRYWTIKLANVSGSDFSLDTIDCGYTTSSRGVVLE